MKGFWIENSCHAAETRCTVDVVVVEVEVEVVVVVVVVVVVGGHKPNCPRGLGQILTNTGVWRPEASAYIQGSKLQR
ncbi:hypothetical protein EYF80_038666 [Liparis tanakae]|uniref:Uncharacterized protein n=1 Tax=Liparis tanakae TaxID=230148 RepID=A0A4Z2GDD9_9TELE|nr:hypothetical protein EYF80_038666 [Liparis tanakae]